MKDPRDRKLALTDECRYLKGVGPVRATKLQNLGIESVEDLITHFPRKFYDRRTFSRIADLQAGVEGSIVGQVLSASRRTLRGGRSIITAAVGDDTGILQVVWFNQDYLYKQIRTGRTIIMSGELTYYRGARQVVNPDFEIIEEDLDQELLHAGRLVPVYRLTSGISQRFLRGLISRTLDAYNHVIFENLPEFVLARHDLPSRSAAIRSVHFPDDPDSYQRALERLKLEELFYLQLVFILSRRKSDGTGRVRFNIDFSLEKKYLRSLPFELTAAQKRVLEEIHRDLSRKKGLNRLLQGDVGSGKTVVAGAALLSAVEAGCQAAFMAPTEILAVQHAKTLAHFFDAVGVRVSLLIGALKPGEKRKIHAGLSDGSLPIVIGTHALIQEEVKFKKLGIVVIDEQHRFGVRQRAALLSQGIQPHMLVMTATPIPRTLALTAYADLDLSIIDEMVPGRRSVKTRTVGYDKRNAMLEFVLDELRGGARAYFLYPLIDETEKQDLQAATTAYHEFAEGVFEEVGVGLLHGRMSFQEKEAVMEEFAKGAVRLLVSTTVVEVGVHVPEATIMVIHHPERFGLSQLHQLRGRVGRGGRDGYCFLLLDEGVAPSAHQRLKVLTSVSDGFKIAEEDLKIRGPGEFFGVRQHGVPGFKLANPVVDRRLVEMANGYVKHLLEKDPTLQQSKHEPCRRYIASYSGVDQELGRVG